MTHRFSDSPPEQPQGSFGQRFLSPLFSRLIHGTGRLLGRATYFLDMRHRRIVKRNLRFAMPELSRGEVRCIAKKVFEHYGITILEIIQSSWSRPEHLLQRIIAVEGREHIRHLDGEGGAILVTAHLGNWETANIFASSVLSRPLVAVARSIKNPVLERALVWFRTRLGGELINKKGALPEMRRALKQGRTLALLVDQQAKEGEGVTVSFFGHQVRAHAVVAVLALRYKCPVVPAFCVKEGRGFRVIVEPPLQLERSGDLKADIAANTQKLMDIMEKIIRRYPEQWFWFHKRWRKYYPELYKEDMERKRRAREKKRRRKLKRSGS